MIYKILSKILCSLNYHSYGFYKDGWLTDSQVLKGSPYSKICFFCKKQQSMNARKYLIVREWINKNIKYRLFCVLWIHHYQSLNRPPVLGYRHCQRCGFVTDHHAFATWNWLDKMKLSFRILTR